VADFADVETFEDTSFSDSFELLDEAGDPLDLTGCSATCHARKGSPDQPGVVALTVSTDNGKLTHDGAGGTITRTLTAADLARATFPANDYWYELVVTLAGGSVEYPVRGRWRHFPTGVGQP
jgi:hypothetical protein